MGVDQSLVSINELNSPLLILDGEKVEDVHVCDAYSAVPLLFFALPVRLFAAFV